MAHCKLTNLTSEENFGDLDFSLFRRRNASLHHHTTMNMVRRNKSVSWLCQQSAETQQQLLQLSSKKGASLREKHAQMQKDAVIARKELLQEAQQKKVAAEAKREQDIRDVLNDLKPHNGPCSNTDDIHKLLRHYSKDKDLKKALRAEILFQKLVLGKSSPHLRVTGKSLVLANRLLTFVGGVELARLPPHAPLAKRIRLDTDSGSSDTEDSEDMDTEESESEDIGETETDPRQGDQLEHFSFSCEGELVAVYYENGFFVGQVTKVNDQDNGEINFLEKSKDGLVYRWPAKEDKCNISADVVFASKLSLAPSSSSGRAFVVLQPKDLQARYHTFRQYLFDNLL